MDVAGGGQLRQLTDDHSWVEEQVRAGTMTEAAARQHPWRNVVTRALSGGTDPDIDTIEIAARPGERFLLCSDGLSGVVSREGIERILGDRTMALEDICERLVAAANEGGGPDNVTALVIEIAAGDAA
jgi:protein phosphatase